MGGGSGQRPGVPGVPKRVSAEGIQVTPDNLAVIVHKYTSNLATSQKEIQEQAPPSHRGEEPKDIVPKGTAGQQATQTGQTSDNVRIEQTASMNGTNHSTHRAKKPRSVVADSGASKVLTIVEVAAGTSLVFFIQLFQIRRKK